VGCRLRGGIEAEREERRLIREEEEAKKRANFEAMQKIRREGWRRVSEGTQSALRSAIHMLSVLGICIMLECLSELGTDAYMG